jgi:hypothetical protein
LTLQLSRRGTEAAVASEEGDQRKERPGGIGTHNTSAPLAPIPASNITQCLQRLKPRAGALVARKMNPHKAPMARGMFFDQGLLQYVNEESVTTRDSNKRQKPMVESSVAPSERGTMPRKSNRNLPGFIVNDQNSVAWSDPYEPGETPFDFNGQPVRKQRKLANAPAKAGGRKKPHLPPPEENRQPVNTPNPTQSDGSPRTVVPRSEQSLFRGAGNWLTLSVFVILLDPTPSL